MSSDSADLPAGDNTHPGEEGDQETMVAAINDRRSNDDGNDKGKAAVDPSTNGLAPAEGDVSSSPDISHVDNAEPLNDLASTPPQPAAAHSSTSQETPAENTASLQPPLSASQSEIPPPSPAQTTDVITSSSALPEPVHEMRPSVSNHLPPLPRRPSQPAPYEPTEHSTKRPRTPSHLGGASSSSSSHSSSANHSHPHKLTRTLSASMSMHVLPVVPIFKLTDDHIKLLYLVSRYTGRDPTDPGKGRQWIRKIPLLVLIYEGIVQDIFDYDYAPSSELVGNRRMYLNISQEGKDDIDDLREAGFINGLKLSTSEYQSITAYQISRTGIEELKKVVTQDHQDKVDSFILWQGELFQVRADDEEYYLTVPSGYSYKSSVTESEDVSYVTSPYLPACLRAGGRPTTSNKHRIAECSKGGDNIRDDLDIVLVLGGVKLLVGEFIPFGSNQIIALIEKLGASERVKGGLFTAFLDDEPDGMTFSVPEHLENGMTSVEILDFAFSQHLNFEAEVYFEEEEGIVQVEDFGVHLSHDGTAVLGLEIEAILNRDKDNVSLDHLARILADIHQDSSKILESLMTTYQRTLLEMMFLGDALNRDKFSAIIAEKITKRMPADQYLDKEANENELNQVLGAVQSAHDLDSGELLILGRHGLLLVGDLNPSSEKTLTMYLSLMGREIFLSNFFHRTFTLHEVLKNTRTMILDYEKNPNAIPKIRSVLSQASKDAVLLQEILSYISESMEANNRDDSNSHLSRILKVAELHQVLHRRIADLNKNIEGIQHELNGLREMTDVISETTMFRLQESLQANTKSLANVFEASERSSSSLEILQVVLSGTLAFEILDRLTGEWSVMETEWGKYYIHDPLIERPGVWFAINLLLWAIIGWVLKTVMGRLTDASVGVITIRFRPNQRIDVNALRTYLQNRETGEQEVGMESKQTIKKVSWNDDDNICAGKELKIEITWDDDHGYWLTCSIQLNKGKGPNGPNEGEVRRAMFEEFEKNHILSPPEDED